MNKLRPGTLPLLVLVIVVVIAVDQATKIAILEAFRPGESLVIVPGLFSLVLNYNPGAAFGMLAGADPLVRTVILGATTIIALGFICFFLFHDYYENRVGQVALALLLGGAVGNLIDRVRFGQVVDFLDFYVRGYHWPAFNVADSCICVGVFVLILWQPKKANAVTAAVEPGN